MGPDPEPDVDRSELTADPPTDPADECDAHLDDRVLVGDPNHGNSGPGGPL